MHGELILNPYMAPKMSTASSRGSHSKGDIKYLTRRAVIGCEVFIFMPKMHTFRDFDGRQEEPF